MKNERVHYTKRGGIGKGVMTVVGNGTNRVKLFKASDLGGADGARIYGINMISNDANDDGIVETNNPGSPTAGSTLEYLVIHKRATDNQDTIINRIRTVNGTVPTDLMSGANLPQITDENGNKYFNIENNDQIDLRIKEISGGLGGTFCGGVYAEEY